MKALKWLGFNKKLDGIPVSELLNSMDHQGDSEFLFPVMAATERGKA